MINELIQWYSRSLQASERNKFYLVNADESTRKLIGDKVEKEQITLNALKKQKAERVQYSEYEVNDGDLLMINRKDHRCPSCNSYDKIFDCTGIGLKYCGECGQKLEWED